MQTDVVVQALREALVYRSGISVQAVEGFHRTRVQNPRDEVGLDLCTAFVACQRAVALKESNGDGGAEVLRLHVCESEAHRFEVFRHDVRNAVLGAHDLDTALQGRTRAGGLERK